MNPHQQKPQALRFRRFARAGWAAFSSMHREVTIGRLAARVADCSLAKSAACGIAALLLAPAATFAQSDKESETRQLAEVQITLSADSLMGSPEPAAVLTAAEIKQTNIRSLADLVSLLPGVDARVRGVGDAQADLAMRGGTADQMVLLLNGINLTDVQTGHHTMDIPIDLTMVQRIELLSPAQLMARGIVAFCGAVNIVVTEEYADRLRAEVSAGSHGTTDASLLATRQAGLWSLTASAAYHRSDGYRPNTDYRHGSLFLQAVRHGNHNDLHLQLGGQAKGFGSSGFYSTSYPDQYEATRTLVASAEYTAHRPRLVTHHSLYGRLHADRFELFRTGYVEPPAWYTSHNHHLSSLAGLRSRAIVPLGRVELLAGAELRREGIWSNVLGLSDSTLADPFNHSDVRFGGTTFAGLHYAHRHLNLQAVGLGLAHSRFGGNYGLAADASYRATPHTTFRTSLSRTYRLPSFTDLYYQSATQRSNPDLDAEHSFSLDFGVHTKREPFAVGLSLYYRAGRDIIDWVRRPDAELWYSMNHTAVNTYGVDLSLEWHIDSLRIAAAYSFCHVASDAGEWVSGAALDYLRHRGELRLHYKVTRHLSVGAGCRYRQRQGQWVDAAQQAHPYGGVVLVDANAEYALCKMVVFVEGHNLANADYRDFGGTPMPGRTFRMGVRLDL